MIPTIPITITAMSWIAAAINACPRTLPTDVDALTRLISDLNDRRSSIEFWFDLATAFVVVGVAVEVVIVWIEFRKDRKEYLEDAALYQRGESGPPHKPVAWHVIVEMIAALAVAAGVLGEFCFELRIGDINTCIQQADNARAGLLEKQSDNAKILAAKAELEYSALASRMLDTFGPKTMTSAQSAEMTKKLREMTGVQVDVLVVDFIDAPNSAEFKDSVSTGRSIQDTLNTANLDAEGWVVDSCIEGAGAQGLSVAVHFGAATMDEYLAGKLLAAFPPTLRFVNKVQNWEPAEYCKNPSDLEPTGRPNKRKMGTAKIMVIIGAKTQPILTREMLEPTQP